MPAEHPTYYLTAEAAALRIEKLVARIARDGLQPNEWVPQDILDRADAMRRHVGRRAA